MSDVCVWHDSEPFSISSSLVDFDFGRVHGWLANAYWSKGIPLETVVKAFTNSLSFGLYHKEHGQVGCARMITDKATFAYLADVYVDEAYRGHSLGIWLMTVVMAHEDLQGLRRVMLATSNMQRLYAKFGFSAPQKPETLMEKLSPEIYQALYGGD